jgi:hypothetical protein
MAKPLPLPVWDRQRGKLVEEWMDDHQPHYESEPQRSLTQWIKSQRFTTGSTLFMRTRAGAHGKLSPLSASITSTWPSSGRSGIARLPNSSTGASVPASGDEATRCKSMTAVSIRSGRFSIVRFI